MRSTLTTLRHAPLAALAALSLLAGPVVAQSGPPPAAAAASAMSAPAAPPTRLRGTIQAVDANGFTLLERSGERIVLAFADGFGINEVVPIDLPSVQAGAFVGVAAMPQADGTLRALELLVFPEAARGSGEGSYAWDLQPGSTMTNATVAELTAAPEGRTLKLKYKDGEKTVVVPANVPVVTFKPGDKSLLVPGAKAFVAAQVRGDKPVAIRAVVGRNGFAPPM